MNITDARLWVRDAIRDGASTAHFSDATIDRAIQQAGLQFCRETRAVTRTDSVTITEGSTSFPTTTPLTFGFLPERILDVRISGEETTLTLVDIGMLNRLTAQDDSAGVPTALAFETTTGNGTLWKEPDDGYTAKLRYYQPFGVTVSATFSTLWTAGTDVSATLAGTLNIPDHLIPPVLKYGAAGAALEANKETRALADMLMRQFRDYIAMTKGAGGLGARVGFARSVKDVQASGRWLEDRPGPNGE
jgi:hypothetical protein